MAFDATTWMTPSGGYEITNSLRMNGNADLDRTPDASNRRTYTLSAWVKRSGALSASNCQISLMDVYADTNNFTRIVIESDDKLQILSRVSNQNTLFLQTTSLFRDVSAWYHIVVAVDTTDGTANDRVKIYINGVVAPIASRTNPDQNYDGHINAAVLHDIGKSTDTTYDGYLAEYNFIDGLALAPAAFGETGKYGEWKPIAYAGAYGDEGFYLDFKSSGVGTAGSSTVGADRSGNGNHYTSSNIAVSDQMLDSPTNNFCTWNSIFYRYNVTNAYSEGNTKISFTSSGTEGTGFGSIGGLTSGKWYWEVLINAIGSGTRIGISNSLLSGNSPTDFREFLDNHDGTGSNKPGTFNTSYGNAFGDGDLIGVGLDIDNGTLTFFKNNTSQNVAFTDILSAIPEGGWMPMGRGYGSPVNTTNWGQDSTFAGVKTAGDNADANSIGNFFYAPPSGHLALCTANLPEPTVIPSEYFKAVIYTGDGNSTHAITGVGFRPDWLWIKNRSDGAAHTLQDVLRGPTATMYSQSAEGENATRAYVASFNADGFTTGNAAGAHKGPSNHDGDSYVGWNWKADGSGASNTDGSINTTKTIASVKAGFSISTYTGTGSGATIGHGLSKAPEMIIVKNRVNSRNWRVYHEYSGASDPETDFVNLDTTEALADNVSWNDTAPTASVFSITNNGDRATNHNGDTFVAYCFHSVDGYSKVGSYRGNGNADGAFVYTGFRPAWILRKRMDATTHWHINDNARIGFNGAGSNLSLRANVVDTEDDANRLDLLSNGFKVRTNSGDVNNNNSLFIYLAFAEIPFKYSNGK